MTTLNHSYYVVMLEYPARYFEGMRLAPAGREAIVDPEITRREVVSRILSREYDPEAISFIHHIHDGQVEDVTFDIIAECAREALAQSPRLTGQDLIDWRNDHRRDHEKNWIGAL